jgi:small subunit ribosomal protein S2
VSLYCDLVSSAVLDGIRAEIAASGGDVGEFDAPPVEEIPAVPEGGTAPEAAPAE